MHTSDDSYIAGSYEERCENYKAAKKRKLEDGINSEYT